MRHGNRIQNGSIKRLGKAIAFVAIVGAASPVLAFDQEGDPPALRLGRLGTEFVAERECYPADGMYQVAFNESTNVHYLIARADCYAATGETELALEGFEWAEESDTATRPSERSYIARLLARLRGTTVTDGDATETSSSASSGTENETPPNGYALVSALFRTNDVLPSPNALVDFNEPHVAAELGWHPFSRSGVLADDVTLFARAAASLETNGAKIDQDTIQGGVGLRLEPFSFADLTVRAEWLFPIGDDTYEGWMVSGEYNWGTGQEWQSTEYPWIFANTNLRASWLPDEPEYVSASGETILGIAVPLGERVAVIPHGVATLRYNEDESIYNALGEAGAGLTFRAWFNDGRPRGTMDWTVQYRWLVLEDTVLPPEEDGAWIGRLTVRR